VTVVDRVDRTGPVVHPAALCESDTVGARTRVWPFAHVMQGAVVGSDCNVCGHAFIESGAIVGDRVTVKNNAVVWDRVVIEDDVFVGPGVAFTNDPRPRADVKKPSGELVGTIVRRGATIGAHATIVCGVTIGARAFVGAGAVVVRDVPDHALVVGNPARQIGWVCDCGERLEPDMTCRRGCGHEVGRKRV
jgi:acetyltransferase-like isoleucine patch superfamily enzyme